MQKFQVGQKVRVVGNSYGGYWDNGEVVTIINAYKDSEGWSYDVKIDIKEPRQQVYHENDLKPVTKKTKVFNLYSP